MTVTVRGFLKAVAGVVLGLLGFSRRRKPKSRWQITHSTAVVESIDLENGVIVFAKTPYETIELDGPLQITLDPGIEPPGLIFFSISPRV